MAIKAWLFCSKIRWSSKCYNGGILRNRSIFRKEWYVVWGLWVLFFATKVKSMTQVKMAFFSAKFWILGFQNKCVPSSDAGHFWNKRIPLIQKLTLYEILMISLMSFWRPSIVNGCVVQTSYLPAGVLWAEFKVVLLNTSSACSSFWLYV